MSRHETFSYIQRILKMPKPKKSNLVKEYNQTITILNQIWIKVVPVKRRAHKGSS
jgi:hypothetical protein